MTPREFAALATVAVLSLITAIAVYSARAPGTLGATGTGKLVPGLAARAGEIARLSVTQGGRPLVIEKTGDTWLVKSQDGYPAETEKVRALVTSLADATLLEPKTRVSTRYAALEVDDPTGKNSNARLIKLETADGATIAEVIAGKPRLAATGAGAKDKGGTYVRRPGDEQSWLASTSITGGAALKDWATARVFENPADKVRTLTVTVAGETPYEIKRADDGSHTLAAIPAGKKVKYVNMIDNIVEAASFLDFDNVRKADASTAGEAGTVAFETESGLKIALKVRRDKDAVWIAVDPASEGDAKTAADGIRTRTAGWEFSVTPSKADTMLKKLADLLEDDTPASAPGAEGASPPGAMPHGAMPPGTMPPDMLPPGVMPPPE
ncbi:MAG: DUF4340 domain-containing protein [Parvibaculaceae bacterium]